MSLGDDPAYAEMTDEERDALADRILEAGAAHDARCPRCRGTGGGEYNDCAMCDGNGVV